jgi:hypothetical protein
MNANCRHPSVAFKRTYLANSPTCHSGSNFGTAGIAVKLRINKESSLGLGMSLNTIRVHSTFYVF